MTYRAPVNDMLFMMRHVGGLDHALRDGSYPDLSLDVIQDILGEAGRFAGEVLAPINRTGDRHGAQLRDGVITTAPGFKEAYQAWVAGGWSALAGPVEYGGQDLPQLINAGCFEMWNGACLAFGVAPLLTFGGAEAVAAHGSVELKQRYLAKLVAGEWTATMNLTEPHAGSDLSAVRTRAEPAGDGSYRIKGQKIFISYGEHDLTDNIVHLVLARLPDAPKELAGSRFSWCRRCCRTERATTCAAAASSTSSASTRAPHARWSLATAMAPLAGSSARSTAGSRACSP